MAVYREVSGVGSVAAGSGAAAYRETQTVTTNVTVTTAYSSAVTGDWLTKVLTIDATGGYQITSWNAIFTGVTVNDFDNRANRKNTYLFQWTGTKWDLVSTRFSA